MIPSYWGSCTVGIGLLIKVAGRAPNSSLLVSNMFISRQVPLSRSIATQERADSPFPLCLCMGTACVQPILPRAGFYLYYNNVTYLHYIRGLRWQCFVLSQSPTQLQGVNKCQYWPQTKLVSGSHLIPRNGLGPSDSIVHGEPRVHEEVSHLLVFHRVSKAVDKREWSSSKLGQPSKRSQTKTVRS